MARKNLLDGLLSAASPAPPSPAPAAAPRYAKGAIGAVSRSIADLKSRALIDLDPHLIDAGGMQDRMEPDAAADAALLASLRDYGQQVPVLVRPHPQVEGRYQIVYGRRRVLALRDLGLPVKALLRDMDDRALVLAQGQENTARRDLSFIEKANFARQMVDAGYERKIICDALSIDKTVISRMLAVMDQIPLPLIAAIGPAPAYGRDRWLALAALVVDSRDDTDTLVALVHGEPGGPDARFEALMRYLSTDKRRHKAAAPDAARRSSTPLTTEDGVTLGSLDQRGGKTTLHINDLADDGFAAWLAAHITEIHRRWRDGE